MWKCKHCNQSFSFETNSERANHSRWCLANPKRNNWNKTKAADDRFGELTEFSVICSSCQAQFNVVERRNLHPQKEAYYCSRSCANSVGGNAKADKYHYDEVASYTAVCWRHHEKKCIVCDENKIVAVHHNDHNHENNDPINLIPLCPTHHQYVHSRYRDEVQPIIDKYVKDKWGR